MVYNVLTTKLYITQKVNLNMTIDTTTNILNNTAGIALAGKIFNKIGLDLKPEKGIDSRDKQVLKTMAGLLVQGRTRFVEIDLFRQDLLFKKSMALKSVYAPETVRIYLDKLAKPIRTKFLPFLIPPI